MNLKANNRCGRKWNERKNVSISDLKHTEAFLRSDPDYNDLLNSFRYYKSVQIYLYLYIFVYVAPNTSCRTHMWENLNEKQIYSEFTVCGFGASVLHPRLVSNYDVKPLWMPPSREIKWLHARSSGLKIPAAAGLICLYNSLLDGPSHPDGEELNLQEKEGTAG